MIDYPYKINNVQTLLLNFEISNYLSRFFSISFKIKIKIRNIGKINLRYSFK